MGRSATFYCHTCKTEHYLGHGSYGTWLDGCKTVEEFDQQPEDTRSIFKNQNMRKALVRHEGHEFMTQSSDWTHTHPGKLCGEFGTYGACVTLIDDYDSWSSEPFAE